MPTPEQYEEALLKIQDLHPAPQVLAKATVLVQDPDVEVKDLADLIKTDAALAADIIRLSNNAFYGFEIASTNLLQAINRVGFRGVLKLINMSVSKSLIAKDLLSYGITANVQWSDSASVALLMESLANRTGENPHDAYTVGLLHAVGRVVIDRLICNSTKAVWDASKPYPEWEQEQVGFSSPFAGSYLLTRWGFPKPICQAILRQSRDSATVHTPIERLLHFSIEYVTKTGPGFTNLHWAKFDNQDFLEFHNIGETDLEEISLEAKEHFDEMKAVLGIA